ncbi:type II toxin-antitoxin system RelE/ParE family toxin, partial [Dorea longicatena]|uniref:type II toxin-antitoxin system RelE/ParE family toxin n=1 Tax=Dorea longicatena TaxID=88431 RepID=UPI001FA98307
QGNDPFLAEQRSAHAERVLCFCGICMIYRLKSKEAAKHLLDSVESIYDQLVENPYQFPKSRDMYLAKKGYYEAVIPQMNYIVIFDVRKDIVNIVGIFHQLENYLSKL